MKGTPVRLPMPTTSSASITRLQLDSEAIRAMLTLWNLDRENVYADIAASTAKVSELASKHMGGEEFNEFSKLVGQLAIEHKKLGQFEILNVLLSYLNPEPTTFSKEKK